MTSVEPFADKINMVIGAIVAILTYLFGAHWRLFGFFLLLNVGDYITRWMAARITGTENSKAGWVGILKKLGYWIMIAVGFGMSVIFIEIGEVIGIDFSVTTFVGWFVLATLIINEIRSIFENLVEAGYPVPNILIKGLEVANKAIDGKLKISDEGLETILHKDKDEIQIKGKATLEVEDNRTRTSD